MNPVSDPNKKIEYLDDILRWMRNNLEIADDDSTDDLGNLYTSIVRPQGASFNAILGSIIQRQDVQKITLKMRKDLMCDHRGDFIQERRPPPQLCL